MEVLDRIAPVIARLAANDCRVIWLAGSHAIGDAGPFSDVDLGVIPESDRRGMVFEEHDGLLLSISVVTELATRASFSEPRLVGAAVPGWRDAILILDKDGTGAALKTAAVNWDWDALGSAPERWCCDQAVRAADDVLKLANARSRGDMAEAVLRRNALAAFLPLVMSVRRRLLYGSERRLFGMVNAELGSEWARKHAVALGSESSPIGESCDAAAWLYRRVVSELDNALGPTQRRVVELALSAVPEE